MLRERRGPHTTHVLFTMEKNRNCCRIIRASERFMFNPSPLVCGLIFGDPGRGISLRASVDPSWWGFLVLA